MALDTIGSIATYIAENLSLSTGVSGNLVEIVDMARQHVANYTGETIGSNSINAEFQPAIVHFANADTLDMVNADSGGADLKLAELSIVETGQDLSSRQLRMMGENALHSLGRRVNFARSLS